MRRKPQNSLYHTAFEDNLRLQTYSNPQFSLQQAEAQIAKFNIESLRDRSKNRSSILPKRPLIHLKIR